MLVHCTEKWQVTKKINLRINNLNSSSLIAVPVLEIAQENKI